MPRKSKEQERLYIANIRKLLAVDHDMPLREMQIQLEENGIHLQLNYIGSLRNKYLRDRAKKFDREVLRAAVAEFENDLTQTSKLAWQIALSNQSTRKERIAAMKEIRETKKDILRKKSDAGIYDRKPGVSEGKSQPSLSDEQRKELVGAMVRWGIVRDEETHDEHTDHQ